jgi:hypothetical protein
MEPTALEKRLYKEERKSLPKNVAEICQGETQIFDW